MELISAESTPELPEPFTDLVRDALLHLYDPAQLQAHPLLGLAHGGAASGFVSSGRTLRQALLDAIEALQPERGVAATSRAWRAYRILDLRYLEALDVSDVIGRVALSKSQYHREHQRALHGVAAVLWERWGLGSRWSDLVLTRSGRLAAEALARSEAERLRESASGRIDLLEVLHSALRVIEPLCLARGLEVSLSVPERAPAIRGDRVALRQALLTILGHAAGELGPRPHAGPLLTADAEPGRRNGFSTATPDEHVVLTVSATAEVGRITLTISGPGSPGLSPARLGMTESAPFVEALGGSVSYFPATRPSGYWSIDLAFPAEEPPLLLVVDNNDDFRRLVERFLVGHPWDVVGAASVDEAYALACHQHPGAILLDVVIPGRDGWELLLELKQLPSTRDIPVIICSVLDEPAVAIALGAAAYLQKPIDQDRLLAALNPLLTPPATGPLAIA
jgi:CheY-like chemotaxis protein